METSPGVHGGVAGRVDGGHLLHDAHHLAAVAELVVVPDVEHRVVSVSDGRESVDDARAA